MAAIDAMPEGCRHEDEARREPWPLAWDDRLRRRFWAGVESGPRSAEVFSRRCGRHLVAAVAHRFAPGSRLWELGARNGALAEAMLTAGYPLALDGSELVDTAAVRRDLGVYPGFLGLVDRPLRGSMDVVLWVDGLATVEPNRARARLAAARRALRRGGILVLTAPNAEELDYGLALCPGCGALYHQWQHVSRHTSESLETLVRECGFETLSVQQLELTEATFRGRAGLGQELIDNPLLHAGNGETLVVVAQHPGKPLIDARWPLLPSARSRPATPPPQPQPVQWTRQRVADFWDGIAETRLVDLGFGRQSGRRLLQVLAPWLIRGQRHLDYGAGNGDLAAVLLEAGYPTATFEPSPHMQERQRGRLGQLPGFLGVVDQGTVETFDTVLLCEVIEHILPADLDEVLCRLNRLLPIDGTLVVSTPSREDLDAGSLPCPACDTLFHRWQHLRAFDPQTLQDLLARYGFAHYVTHEVELTDSAFLASPYAEPLFRSTRPIRFGLGSTLVYIGRKVAEAGAVGKDAPPAQAGLTPVAQGVAQALAGIRSARGGAAVGAAVLLEREPSVRELWELRQDPGAVPILGPVVGPGAALGPRPLVHCDLATGALPPALFVPADLVLVGPADTLTTAAARALMRAGARRVWLADNPGWPRPLLGWVRGRAHIAGAADADPACVDGAASDLLALGWRGTRAVARAVLPTPWRHWLWGHAERVRTVRDRVLFRVQLATAPPLDSVSPVLAPADFAGGPIVHANNALAWGGVERQLVYVLKGLPDLARRPVALLCLRLADGEDYRFYLPALQGSGVEAADIRDRSWAAAYLEGHLTEGQRRTVARAIAPLPSDVRWEVRRFLAEILERRPEAVHAWQDATSVSLGYAAVLAGVPRIVLSSRNLRPTNFAYYRPYMHYGYRVLAAVRRLVLVNNSAAGAADYAQWIGIPRERFKIKRNGIDPDLFQRASAAQTAAFRRGLGIPEAAPLVGAVFRLYPEKRPLLWVEMAAQVARRHPQAHFAIFGTGPMTGEARDLSKRLGIGERLHLPGTTREPQLAMSAMDVCVLASGFEGTPNVVLEAQLLGVPVVATDAGGTRESFDPGRTGWLVEEPTAEALAERVCSVLEDDAWRARAQAQGPGFVVERFGLERMIRETYALYGLGSGSAD